jgi:MFS superfamily sulfate permease-like transporter
MKLMEPLGQGPVDALEVLAAPTYVPPYVPPAIAHENSSAPDTPMSGARWSHDFTSGITLAVIAFPLSLGIALASGAPLISAIIAGIVGAVVVGRFSKSPLLVSGPAAGLVAVTMGAIAQLGSFRAFLVAVVLAGLMQIVLGLARADVLRYYMPSGVVKGALAAMGVVLMLGQIPFALGYSSAWIDADGTVFNAGAQTFSNIAAALQSPRAGAVVICLLSLAVLILWNTNNFSRMRVIPAPLVVITLGIVLNGMFVSALPELALRDGALVNVPVIKTIAELPSLIVTPDWSVIGTIPVVITAFTIALVASFETLISLEATDKLNPRRSDARPNQELIAQGIGNTVSGLVGGLPITGQIVQSAASIDAGARSRSASVSHGIALLLVSIMIPLTINRIPLAAVAAILLHTGYRLAQPALWTTAWSVGRSHFGAFAVTVLVTVFTNLLVGVGAGLAVGLFVVLVGQTRTRTLVNHNPPGAVLRRYVLPERVTFLAKAEVAQTFAELPHGSRVEIDGRAVRHIDQDILELILNFKATATMRDIDLRLVGTPNTHTSSAQFRG